MIVEGQNGCHGLVDPARSGPIRVPKLGPDGGGVPGARGATVTETINLPYHVVMRPSHFDATGLSPASCNHGLRRHPDPIVQADPVLGRKAVSWIRSRYLWDSGRASGMAACPVCRGEPRPDDLTNGFVDPPEPDEAEVEYAELDGT